MKSEKPKVSAERITAFKNNAYDACYFVSEFDSFSVFSGKKLLEGTEVVFIPRFGMLSKSEYKLFANHFLEYH
tara:strand:- start:2268 stop:2486 length:219 start_codon:yes stop_codon:yes gene_type:complete